MVGLGAMGSAVAWQLASRGQRVVGFDRFRPPHKMGSSTGRSRIIREAYFESPFYVPLVRRAYQLWEQLEQARGERLLRRTGGLAIGPAGGWLIAGALESAEIHGVAYRRLSAREVRERYPLFQPLDPLEGVWEPRAGVLVPEVCIAAMLAEAERAGAELHFDEPVLEWDERGDGVEVRTGERRVAGASLVLAAGAWMAGPLPQVRLPLEVARQVVFWIKPEETDRSGPGRMVMDNASQFTPERFPVWLWETVERRIYYGFPDLGEGPKIARHHGGPVVSPETVERQVAATETEEVMAFLAQGIPSLRGTVTDAQVCLYTNTPDEHFIIDRHPQHARVLLASPCSGHGFKFAPAVGEALADWVMGRGPKVDLTPFRLSRFPRS